jgi:hypothetical protein
VGSRAKRVRAQQDGRRFADERLKLGHLNSNRQLRDEVNELARAEDQFTPSQADDDARRG